MTAEENSEDRRWVRKFFSHGPYTPCPACKKQAFGMPMMGIGEEGYTKECYECTHREHFELPKLQKKLVYLDQFVIDNIVKTLDPMHPKHEVVRQDPFWLALFEKLDPLVKAQLVVCPDSFFHQEESAPTGYVKSVERIYTHFSGGATFYDHDHIVQEQMGAHFRNFLREEPQKEPTLEATDVVMGDLHRWWDRIKVVVSMQPTADRMKSQIEHKDKLYNSFLEVFERWKGEKHKKFDDWYTEETQGFATGTLLAVRNHYKRHAELPARVEAGEQVDFSDLLPPPSFSLLEQLRIVALQEGVAHDKAVGEVIRYLSSPHLNTVPVVRIGSLLLAALADQAAHGRKKPPSPGVMTDMNMISSFLPYCEALFVDKENEAILSDRRVRDRLGYQTKIFSRRNKEEFLEYLDEIKRNADPAQLKLKQDVYGETWTEPYTTILTHMRAQDRLLKDRDPL